jgi:UDP-N-acetylglucosamine--N-acetylmuramyl-(pentapeptide) pyrophosphoryl-undecaprenol N-acetylglucosamine transferase
MRESGRRIFLAGGGTGGHLYPGLAIAEALRALQPDVAIAFSSTTREIDRTVLAGCGYPVTPIGARPFSKKPWTWPALLLSLVRTGNQARRRLREFCPDVVVGLGGFGSYAPVRIGQKYGAATAILNPDIVAGRANRRLSRWTDRIFCQFRETVDALGRQARLTGCPIRPSLLAATREQGVAEFSLDPAKRTLLVTGASLGARTINRSVVRILSQQGVPDGWQVLHLSGKGDYEEVAKAYREAIKGPAVVRAYCDKMGLAYAAADLAIARAGASTVAELMAMGLPTIFMPYPFHRDQHQAQQARSLEALGAAIVIEDRPDDLDDTLRRLAGALKTLLENPDRLAKMATCARAAGRPRAAEAIAREILELADRVTEQRHARIAATLGPGDHRNDHRNVDKGMGASYTRSGDEKA